MSEFKPARASFQPTAGSNFARPPETVIIAERALPRLVHVAAALLYLFLFLFIYARYISVVWNYTGLRYRELSLLEDAGIAGGVALVAAAMPRRIERPSSIVLWLMFTFVYVPTMAITFMVGYLPPENYVGSLTALTAAFVVACWSGQLPITDETGPRAIPGAAFQTIMIVAGIAMTVFLFVYFRAILSFAGIDRIYVQRFMAGQLTVGIVAYISTYYSFVVGTSLVAIGVTTRNRFALGIGFISFILTYMISAQKTSLIMPILMLAVFTFARFTKNRTSYYTFGMCFLVLICILVTYNSVSSNYWVNLLLSRSISIPAQTFSQYHDFFEKLGHTWWSNIKGINLVVPAPEAFASDPYWPNLGILVGREYSGSVLLNANANLFAGEGVAAAGTTGVVVIGIAWAIWLRALDLASRGWDRTFVLLVMAPVALCLTNGHLSTVLLSFGGFFWTGLFAWYKPRVSALPSAHMQP